MSEEHHTQKHAYDYVATPGVIIMRIVCIVLILGLAAGIGFFVWKNRPVPQRTEPAERVLLVETMPLKKGDFEVTVDAMGTVIPVREVNLKPQVNGEIIKINPSFQVGRILKVGEELLKIDPSDFEIALKTQEAALIQAKAELELEKGRALVAQKEVELLKKEGEESEDSLSLALRIPQLKKAEAIVKSREVALEKAKLDLKRTSVKVPFDCVVMSKMVDLGTRLSTQDILANLVDIKSYWVEALVPENKLKWIMQSDEFYGQKENASVCFGGNNSKQINGRVVRVLKKLDERGKQARILIEVKDPLSLNNKKSQTLLLGSFVNVKIKGDILKNVSIIPRRLIRDGKYIYVMDKDKRLKFLHVKVVFLGKEEAVVDLTLEEGDQIIKSNLSLPLEGMLLDNGNHASVKEEVK